MSRTLSQLASMMPPPQARRISGSFIHPSAWKVNSAKSAYSVVHIMAPQSPKARSSTQPHLIIDSYMLWCWIDIQYHEHFTDTVALDRITHVSCEALHPPVSGVSTPRPRPCRRLRAFPCWVSSASTYPGSWLCRRAEQVLNWSQLGTMREQEDRARISEMCQRILSEVAT
jgi:hypothetical protein